MEKQHDFLSASNQGFKTTATSWKNFNPVPDDGEIEISQEDIIPLA
jgi:hypothetical protein